MAPLSRLSRADFPTVLARGVSFHGSNYRVSVAPKEGPFCYTAVVSKKIAKLAVDRNREKRRVRGILTGFEKKVRSGFLCAVFIKKSTAGVSHEVLKAEIASLLEKAHLFEQTYA